MVMGAAFSQSRPSRGGSEQLGAVICTFLPPSGSMKYSHNSKLAFLCHKLCQRVYAIVFGVLELNYQCGDVFQIQSVNRMALVGRWP